MYVHMNSHTHSHTLETLSGSLSLFRFFAGSCVSSMLCVCACSARRRFFSIFVSTFQMVVLGCFLCAYALSLCLYSPRRDCGTVHTLAFADNVQMQRAEKKRAAGRPTQDAATSDSTCPHRLVGSWSRCWQRIRRKLCGWFFTVQSGSRLS